MQEAIRLEGVTKTYRGSAGNVTPVLDFSHEVPAGSCHLLRGASGCGKTTLLNLVGCLARPTRGAIWLGDKDISRLPEQFLARIRRERIGFIFQSYNLLPGFTALQNACMGLIPAGVAPAERAERATRLMETLGVAHRAHFTVNDLSGGEQQRIAIARALINDPDVILADEPNSNVDEATSRRIADLLRDLHARGKTIMVASHDAYLTEALSPDQVIDMSRT